MDRRRGVEQAWPLTFVGNSWWRKAREDPSPWVRREANSFSRRHRVTRGALADGMLRKLVQIRPPAGGSGRARFDVARAVLAEASLQTRGRFARALLPQGLRVHGDPGWRELVPGIEQRPYVDYETELASLFAASAVNANVTAEQMPTAVNQRVWDVPGTGAFLLTDAQEDALEFFKEDEEVVVYRDFSEAADKARYYHEHGSARRAIAARAFEVVERSHRYVHRLAELERVMRRRFG